MYVYQKTLFWHFMRALWKEVYSWSKCLIWEELNYNILVWHKASLHFLWKPCYRRIVLSSCIDASVKMFLCVALFSFETHSLTTLFSIYMCKCTINVAKTILCCLAVADVNVLPYGLPKQSLYTSPLCPRIFFLSFQNLGRWAGLWEVRSIKQPTSVTLRLMKPPSACSISKCRVTLLLKQTETRTKKLSNAISVATFFIACREKPVVWINLLLLIWVSLVKCNCFGTYLQWSLKRICPFDWQLYGSDYVLYFWSRAVGNKVQIIGTHSCFI